jgi:hypothetical protein
MAFLSVGQLVEFVDENRTERVLWIDRSECGYVMIDIGGSSVVPVFRRIEEVSQLLAVKLAREVPEDPWMVLNNEASLPQAHKERRDKAWAMIRPLIDQQPAIFNAKERGRIVCRLVAETGANRPNLYRLLRRYWQRGLTRNAVLPDFNRCGGRGKLRAATDKKRGRPSDCGIKGINVNAEIRTLLQGVVMQHFAVNRKINVADCYTEFLSEYYTDDVIDEVNGRQTSVTQSPCPSLRQFRYWFEKDNDLFKLERRRRTPRVYDKDMRALLSTSNSEVFGPGSRYQIDATIGDAYLVSRLNPNRIVGRPVIYVVIDVFSRMIVGIYVGLEGLSWVGAMMAIANAAADKVAFCRRFGIGITEADWPCHHVPDALLGDRGEMLGSAVETLINNFHVRVENAAPYRADWKGIFEQRFRLLPAVFKPYTPGFIDGDFRQRGARDYRLDGRLTIEDFTAVVISCVLDYNNESRLGGYERDSQMIADDVAPVPIELWEWGIARRSGLLRSYPETLVYLSVLPSDKATVTVHGIRFYGCYYTCPMAITGHWFEKARQKGTWKVRVSYDPRCMDEIHLHQLESGRVRFTSCVLTERSSAYRDRTLPEIDQILREERRQKNAHEPRARQGKVTLLRTIRTIVARAEERYDARPQEETSNRQRVQGIRNNRRSERRDRQAQEAFRTQPPPNSGGGEVAPLPGSPPEEDYTLPTMPEIVRWIERERGDDDQRG